MSVQTGPGRYVLFGHPVGHSWSPFIHGLFARQFDHVVDYKLRDVEPAEFRHEVINFFVEGGGGAHVTLPHKPAAAEVVNELSARASNGPSADPRCSVPPSAAASLTSASSKCRPCHDAALATMPADWSPNASL